MTEEWGSDVGSVVDQFLRLVIMRLSHWHIVSEGL